MESCSALSVDDLLLAAHRSTRAQTLAYIHTNTHLLTNTPAGIARLACAPQFGSGRQPHSLHAWVQAACHFGAGCLANLGWWVFSLLGASSLLKLYVLKKAACHFDAALLASGFGSLYSYSFIPAAFCWLCTRSCILWWRESVPLQQLSTALSLQQLSKTKGMWSN